MNKNAKQQRKIRVSMKVRGTEDRPRLSVFRSNKFIYAQIIDDSKRVTLVGVSERQMDSVKGTKTQKAEALGKSLAQKAKTKKITKVVFDKGSYRYHGRIEAVAKGAREGGLIF